MPPFVVPFAPTQIYQPNGRLADLIRASGQDAARLAELKGQQQSQGLYGIGNTLQQGVANVQQAQQQAPRIALDNLQLKDAQRNAAGGQAVAGAMQEGNALNPGDSGPTQPSPYMKQEGDVSVWDIPKLTNFLSKAGFGDKADTLLSGAQKMNDAHRQEGAARATFQQAQANTVASSAGALYGMLKGMTPDQIAQAGPQLYDLVASQHVANGAPPDQAARLRSQLFADPTQTLQMLDSISKTSTEKATPLAKDAILPNPANPSGPPLASNVVPDAPTTAGLDARYLDITTRQKQQQPVSPQDQAWAESYAQQKAATQPPVSNEWKDVLLDGKPSKVFVDPKTRTVTTLDGKTVDNAGQRIKPIPPANTIINPALVPTGDALDMAAKRYLATGDLPSMGMGQAGVAARVAVMNKAATIDPQASLAANKAVYKADTTNLSNLQKTEGTLSAFENTAGKNLDQFMALANKIPDTGVPWLNTPVRLLNQNAVGSENMAAITAARDVALREIARVTSDPKLSGALTDSARQEVASLSPQNATLPQIKAVVKVLKQDMANVHLGLNQQIDTVKSGLGANPAAPSTQTPAQGPKPTGRYNPATGKVEPL